MSPLVELSGVSVEFSSARGLGQVLRRDQRAPLRAVNDVDLRISSGESVALVGESGCGKSSLARAIVGLNEIARGELRLAGAVVPQRRPREMLRRVQMVFQDPSGSLNPALTVEQALLEPMRAHRRSGIDASTDRCRELMEMVELSPKLLRAKPRQLSGGQRQRVSIARALSVQPDVIIADEAVSALDVSVQAAIINLLRRLQREQGLTMLFISHNIAAVRQATDRIVVMYLGSVVEDGPADEVIGRPQHPYTQALLAAVPRLTGPAGADAVVMAGEPPSPTSLPAGCAFHPRCPAAVPEVCATQRPVASERGDHLVRCHVAWTPVRSPRVRSSTDVDGGAAEPSTSDRLSEGSAKET